jgi:NCAIR mutase (PurE)-related protein
MANIDAAEKKFIEFIAKWQEHYKLSGEDVSEIFKRHITRKFNDVDTDLEYRMCRDGYTELIISEKYKEMKYGEKIIKIRKLTDKLHHDLMQELITRQDIKDLEQLVERLEIKTSETIK